MAKVESIAVLTLSSEGLEIRIRIERNMHGRRRRKGSYRRRGGTPVVFRKHARISWIAIGVHDEAEIVRTGCARLGLLHSWRAHGDIGWQRLPDRCCNARHARRSSWCMGGCMSVCMSVFVGFGGRPGCSLHCGADRRLEGGKVEGARWRVEGGGQEGT